MKIRQFLRWAIPLTIPLGIYAYFMNPSINFSDQKPQSKVDIAQNVNEDTVSTKRVQVDVSDEDETQKPSLNDAQSKLSLIGIVLDKDNHPIKDAFIKAEPAHFLGKGSLEDIIARTTVEGFRVSVPEFIPYDITVSYEGVKRTANRVIPERYTVIRLDDMADVTVTANFHNGQAANEFSGSLFMLYPYQGRMLESSTKDGKLRFIDVEQGAYNLRLNTGNIFAVERELKVFSDDVEKNIIFPPTVTVSGKVLDQSTRLGLPANITFSPADTDFKTQITTDSEGNFAATLQQSNSDIETVSHGYVVLTNKNVPLGGYMEFLLSRGLVIEGRVLDPASNPIASAPVWLLDPMDNHEIFKGSFSQPAVTDNNGFFRFSGLPHIIQDNFKQPFVVYSELETLVQKELDAITMDHGSNNTTKDIMLSKGHILRGRLYDTSFNPVHGIIKIRRERYSERSFKISESSPAYVAMVAETNQNGEFVFQNLPTGIYLVEAELEGNKKSKSKITIKNDESLEIKVKNHYNVTFGIFDEENGNAVEGANIVIYNPENQVYGVTDEFGMAQLSLPEGHLEYFVWKDARENRGEFDILGNSNQDIYMPRNSRFHILDQDTGLPVQYFRVYYKPKSGFPLDRWILNKEGIAELPVRDGSISFIASGYNSFKLELDSRRETTVYLKKE